MKLYAYCLIEEAVPVIVESLTGIGGGQPYTIQCGNLTAVVSDLEAAQADVTRENVLAHERIVRQFLDVTTPLPFRFGTLVTAEQLQSYLDSRQASLRAQLARVRGCVEMSVKVIWDRNAIRDVVPQTGAEVEGVTNVDRELGSGTAFLQAKRREVRGDETLNESAAEIASWLANCLGDSARETVVNIQPRQSLVVAAAHLVERDRLEEYRTALQSAREARSELHFLTSGAWPPYSFTSINS